ncbi:hypothetical protein ACP8HI_04415 [Paenibacillus sp. FA6]|uniref:hypothetical protein n=1 Tax=Paenibacillus sp. FA6 TaxID=3413029 RepID=UPI003F65850C
MGLTYKYLQIGVFLTFTGLGIIRIFDSDFPFIVFFNITSFFLSILSLLYLAKEKVEDLYIPPNRKLYLSNLLSVIMALIVAVIVGFGLLAYFKIVSTSLSDGFAVIALGISLSSSWLSDVIINIIEEDKRSVKKTKESSY